jgi:HlyD family secretion protein
VKKIIVIAAVIVLLISLVVYAYVRQKQPSGGGGGFGRGEMMSSVPVETKPVTNSDIAKVVAATGAINARAEVEVYPKQSGELVELLIDKGDRVKAGQVVARIESTLFEIQVKQAQADLAAAKAAYEKNSSLAFVSAEADFEQAKGSFDRLQSALKQAELDLQLQEKQADAQNKQAEADLRIAQARLDAAVSGARTQEIEQAKVRTENAKSNLDRLTALSEKKLVSRDQVEAAQLQYDIYSAQLSLLEEGTRPEEMEVLKAQVEAAKTSLESAKNNMALVDIKRASLEAAKAQADGAQAAFKEATVAKDAATWEKDLAVSEASVQRAKAALETAQQRLSDCAIKAPMSGIISQRFLDKGDAASPSRSFVNIVDMDVVKIEAKIPARDIVDINVGDQAAIKPDAYPGESFTGTVTNISPVIDRASQTCDIEIESPNPNYKLKPGMFTRVELVTLEHEDATVIPADAIVKEGEQTFVYVVSDGKALKKEVVTGISDGVRTEIVMGLEPNQELVVAGHSNLRDGVPVTVPGRSGEMGGGPGGSEGARERGSEGVEKKEMQPRRPGDKG